MEKETRDEIMGRVIILVFGVASRIVWDLVSRVFDKKKKTLKSRRKKKD